MQFYSDWLVLAHISQKFLNKLARLNKFERRVEISDIGFLQVLCASQAENRSWWCFHWGEVQCSLEHSHGSTTLGGRLNSGSRGAESGQSGRKEGNDCLLTQKTLEEGAILLSFKRLHGMQFMTQIWITGNFFMACQGWESVYGIWCKVYMHLHGCWQLLEQLPVSHVLPGQSYPLPQSRVPCVPALDQAQLRVAVKIHKTNAGSSGGVVVADVSMRELQEAEGGGNCI